MDRKINSTFQDHGRIQKVVENDDSGRFRWRLGRYCNTNCYYLRNGSCQGRKSETGDCQSRWREDHTPVYFEPIDE